MPSLTPLRSLLTPSALTRLAVGWAAVIVLALMRPVFTGSLSAPGVVIALGLIVAVIVVCAFGVVTQAEHLARRLGDPYGTLVLTLSIVAIEVILISAVMLGPGRHPTIARDSVMAVSMIILNLVIGLALVVGGARNGPMRVQRTGVSAYLSLLGVLLTTAFALPAFLGNGGAYAPAHATTVAVLTLGLYGFFLARQMGPQRADFTEMSDAASPAFAAAAAAIGATFRAHRTEVVARSMLLVLTVIPIVLLSHDMASLLDVGLDLIGAPVALAGVLIAMIVFLPETLTTIRAAWAGEFQRVSNLCHGALVSTVGLTIPVVLIIGLLTDQTVVLAESPVNLLLLGATLLLTVTSFFARTTTALHGATHLMLFVIYVMVLFADAPAVRP